MSKVRSVFVWLFLAALLAGVGIGFFSVSKQFFAALSQLDPAVSAAIVAAAATVLASVFGVIWNQRSLKKREITEAHRPNKTAAYEAFIKKIIIPTLQQTKGGKRISEQQLQKLIYDFMGDVLVWASPEFMLAYRKFKTAGQEDDIRVLVQLEDMILAIRRDLGHRDLSLQRGDMIKLLLTDPDTIDELFLSEGKATSDSSRIHDAVARS